MRRKWLRQIYYQLVAQEHIENNKSQYNQLSKLIKFARIDGYIPWDDIEDRVRVYHDLTGWRDPQRFIRWSAENFLTGYQSDLLQTQGVYLEVWIEKDALSTIFIKAAAEYTVPVVACRGYSSVSFLRQFQERLEYQDDRKPIVLYFGDFDPSGVDMLPAMVETLENEMDILQVELKRIALSKDNIYEYDLPHNPNAIKEKDPRTRSHRMKHGDVAVELDALRPDVLVEKIQTAIESEIDTDAYQAERQQQEHDRQQIQVVRDKVLEVIG